MITYDPAKWYGFHKLFALHGSVFPTVIPRCIASSLLVVWVHYEGVKYFPRSPYAHQMFTFGLCFLVVMRTNLAYNRYWEGISKLVVMHSKWTDAVFQIVAFDELSAGAAATAGKKFRQHLVHLMSLMSAAVMVKFQDGDLSSLGNDATAFEGHDITPKSSGDTEAEEVSALPIIGGLSPAEYSTLRKAETEGCSVHFMMHKLVALVSRRHKGGGLAAPPPIVSRIFQELSNGFEAFEGAHKVVMIPFPFPYAQIVQYLQLVFVLSCPFVMVSYVDDLLFQIFFTFLGVFTFCSLNAIASQLEDPFGDSSMDYIEATPLPDDTEQKQRSRHEKWLQRSQESARKKAAFQRDEENKQAEMLGGAGREVDAQEERATLNEKENEQTRGAEPAEESGTLTEKENEDVMRRRLAYKRRTEALALKAEAAAGAEVPADHVS